MLFISRRFTLSVHELDAETIKVKLNDLIIPYTGPRYYRHEWNDKPCVKAYFECTASEKDLETLKKYLQDEFKGIASIIM